MNTKYTVKVSRSYKISLPSHACRSLNIEAGDHLLVDVQDNMIILMPQPDDFVEHMAGLHKEIWPQVNTADYLSQERET